MTTRSDARLAQVVKVTVDHAQIRRWAEARGGRPAVLRCRSEGPAVLRIYFLGYADKGLQFVEWDEFLVLFDDEKLAFLYRDELWCGGSSHFHRFVAREQMYYPD